MAGIGAEGRDDASVAVAAGETSNYCESLDRIQSIEILETALLFAQRLGRALTVAVGVVRDDAHALVGIIQRLAAAVVVEASLRAGVRGAVVRVVLLDDEVVPHGGGSEDRGGRDDGGEDVGDLHVEKC